MSTPAKQASGAVAALQGIRQGLANVKKTAPKRGGDPFLKMAKDGVWTYGQEDIEVHEEQHFAVNPISFEHGSICWLERDDDDESTSAKVLGEQMVSMRDPKPSVSELPEIADGDWSDQMSMQLKGMGGDDDKVQVLFKTNSGGGLECITNIVDAIMQRIDDGETEEIVPVVKLTHETYKHKKYGKIYKPVMDITGFVNMDGVASEAEPEGKKEPEKSKPKKEKQAEPEEADAGEDEKQEEEAPTRTRRRRR